MKHAHQLAFLVITIAGHAVCVQAAEVVVVEPASDAGLYTGDTIRLPAAVEGPAVVLGRSEAGEQRCVPARRSLKGVGRIGIKGEDDKVVEHALFRVGRPEKGDRPADCGKAADGKETLAEVGTLIAVDPDLLGRLSMRRSGWSFGTLGVPYKYQLRGDRSLSGGATLGGYLGRRVSLGDSMNLQAIVFVGATKVDVPVEKDGTPETQSMFGLSHGIGVLGSVKDGFKMGLVLGWDRVSRSADYANNGKPWVSVSLGYDFFN